MLAVLFSSSTDSADGKLGRHLARVATIKTIERTERIILKQSFNLAKMG